MKFTTAERHYMESFCMEFNPDQQDVGKVLAEIL
jgi:hypothetical protein